MASSIRTIASLRRSNAGSSSEPSEQPARQPAPDWRLPAILAAVLFALVVLAFLTRGPGESPPATGAATIVPGNALAYVHLSTDPTRPAVKRARSLAARFPDYPLLVATVLRRFSASVGGSAPVGVDQIKPWLGKEAALALLGTASAPVGSLVILDVRDRRRARAFLATAGALPVGSYRGNRLLRYPGGSELAFIKHYLVIGQDAAVRVAVDVASGRSRSLAASSAYQRAASDEPPDRVLDAYASPGGVRRVLLTRGGLAGVLGSLLQQPAPVGTTISASAVSGGVRINVHRALEPVSTNGASPAQFTPTLQSVIPSGSALLLDTTGLDRAAPRILGAGAVAGLGTRIGPLLSRLGAALTSEGINVQSILSIFQGETALAIASHGGAPSLLIVARTRSQSTTRNTLAQLEAPLAQLFPAPSSGPGQAPEFNDIPVDGVTAHQLALAPGLQLDYAVFDGLVVISTSVGGIAAVASHGSSLAGDALFKETFGDQPGPLRSLVFLDFSQLLSLGEQTGLVPAARLRVVQPDLAKIRAIGLDSTGGESDSTAELFLKIS